MDHGEDLEAFTNVIRSRYYNSGYREGLFAGKTEVIQEGFDKGYAVGSVLEVLKVLEKSFLAGDNNENDDIVNDGDSDKVEEPELLKEIAELRGKLAERIPEIKIATNLSRL